MQLTQPIRRAMQIHGEPHRHHSGRRRRTWEQFAQQGRFSCRCYAERGLISRRARRAAGDEQRPVSGMLLRRRSGRAARLCPSIFAFPLAEIVYCLNDCGTEILIVDEHLLPILRRADRAQAPCVQHVISIGEAIRRNTRRCWRRRRPWRTPCVQATTGRHLLYRRHDGRAKGVMLTQTNMVASGSTMPAGAVPERVHCLSARGPHVPRGGYRHVAGCHAGRRARTFSSRGSIRRPWCAISRSIGVTFTLLVPTMIHLLLEHLAKCPADISA